MPHRRGGRDGHPAGDRQRRRLEVDRHVGRQGRRLEEQADRGADADLGGGGRPLDGQLTVGADGQGGEKDLVQARRWLQAAAKQGHLKAQLHLDSLAKPEATPP